MGVRGFGRSRMVVLSFVRGQSGTNETTDTDAGRLHYKAGPTKQIDIKFSLLTGTESVTVAA